MKIKKDHKMMGTRAWIEKAFLKIWPKSETCPKFVAREVGRHIQPEDHSSVLELMFILECVHNEDS